MKKLFVSFAAAVCALSVTASATVMEFKMNDAQLRIQSEEGTITNHTLDAAPFTVNDRTVVPVRVISESFGAAVEYNEADETVTITKGDKVIVLTIGKNTAVADGREITLDVAPFTENDRTMVPVRFISECLGYQVDYEEYLESVLITDEPAAMTVNGTDVSRATYKMLFDEINGSGYYDNIEDVKATVESLIVQIYALSGNSSMNDDIRLMLKSYLDYESYHKNVNALETTYTQLMIKNVLASQYYAALGSSDSFDIDDETVSKHYEQNYVTAKHILIPTMNLDTGMDYTDKEKADAESLVKDISKRIKKGEDFDKLMNEYSKDTGLEYFPDGYTFSYGEMVAEFEETAFALKEGEVSEPVETVYGYHIIKREPLETISEAVKESIKAELSQGVIQALADDEITNAEALRNDAVIRSITGE